MTESNELFWWVVAVVALLGAVWTLRLGLWLVRRRRLERPAGRRRDGTGGSETR